MLVAKAVSGSGQVDVQEQLNTLDQQQVHKVRANQLLTPVAVLMTTIWC